MMGASAMARDLTYWEYTAMLTVYNERHRPADEVDRPDMDMVQASFDMIAANPRMLN